MSSMHSSMVVAHSIQIVEEVRRDQLVSMGVFPGSLEMGAVVYHVRCHVQANQGKMHKCGELVPALFHLPEAFQV